jgi:hypothetical protein
MALLKQHEPGCSSQRLKDAVCTEHTVAAEATTCLPASCLLRASKVFSKVASKAEVIGNQCGS